MKQKAENYRVYDDTVWDTVQYSTVRDYECSYCTLPYCTRLHPGCTPGQAGVAAPAQPSSR